MKVFELFEKEKSKNLKESVTFSVAKLIHNDEFPDGLYDVAEFERDEMVQCPECEGSGKDDNHPESPCMYCDGKKFVKVYTTEYGELDVNNSNGRTIIQDLLKIKDGDLVGNLEKDQLPEILERLKTLKREYDKFFFDELRGGTETEADFRTKHDIPYYLSTEDMNRYVEALIRIIDFAIKNDATVVWS